MLRVRSSDHRFETGTQMALRSAEIVEERVLLSAPPVRPTFRVLLAD